MKGWLGEADDGPTDGVVTADELISYVEREVRNYTKGGNSRVQSPVDMGDFPDNMILGFSPTKRGEIVAKLPQLSNGTLVIDVNLDSVEVFIDDKSYGAANREKPLTVPGLAAGSHNVRGVRMGYEPVTVSVNVIPGSTPDGIAPPALPAQGQSRRRRPITIRRSTFGSAPRQRRPISPRRAAFSPRR
ncbi:MAG: PEGA domain-containing protein [Ignavibacteriota bacterium]